MYKRVSTEGSGRKILSTIGTVDMNMGQCLTIKSGENATSLTEMKLETISLTYIRIFNGVRVTYAEYCPYRCTRQLNTSLSLRCQFYSSYFFFLVFLVGFSRNCITCSHKHRLG